MTDFIRNVPDWLVPLLILATSVAALAIILERAWLFFRVRAGRNGDEEQLLSHIQRREFDQALKICGKNSHPAYHVVAAMIKTHIAGLDITSLAESEQRKAQTGLRRFLQTLGTISTIAPLLGLLGTVTGMIKSFHAFGGNNVRNTELMGGIDEALITTALGLMVAIPALIAYNYFANRVNAIEQETEFLARRALAELESSPREATKGSMGGGQKNAEAP